MTQEELLEAFKSDRRTPVDVNFGQIPLSPTIGRAGNYNVVQRGVVKDNAASELSRALAQFSQIGGQFKNIQEKAGAMEVQSLDNDEIVRRVESGDTDATGFLKDWGKQRGYSRALYDQYYKTTKVPEIEALTSKIADMTPEELSGFLTNGGQMSAMDDDQMQAALEQQYRDALTPDDTIKLDDHMKVLYNESLRQAPLLAARSLGTVRKKQRDYIDQETTRSLGEALSDIPTDSFVPPHDLTASTDVTGLPTTDQPTNAPAARSDVPLVRGKVTVYSPQKGGDKMEGGYPSAKKGPDGKFLVRTVADVVSGSSDYVTLAGSHQFYGRSYIIPSLPYLDPKTGKVTILENVKGVVHDTGSAFKTAPEGRFDIPLGKDLDNKTMNNYNGLLNNSNVRFVREVNQDGDPEDYKDPNEKPPKPLTADQQREENKASFDIFTSHSATAIGANLNATIQAAKAQGSSFNDATIEAKAIAGLKNTMLTMITQGGDEGAVVAEFNDMLENGEIMLGDKPLFNTVRGKQLYRDLDNAIITKQKQIDQGTDDEESTGDVTTQNIFKDLFEVPTDNLSPNGQRQARKKLDEVLTRARKARSEGEIDAANLREIEGQINTMREEVDNGFRQSPDIVKPDFAPKVIATNGLTNTLTALSSTEAAFTALRDHKEDPIAPFKQTINNDNTGKVREFILEGLTLVAPPAAEKARTQFTEYLDQLYSDRDLHPNQKIEDVDLRAKFEELFETAVLEEYRIREEQLTNSVSRRVKAQATTTDIPEVEIGKTEEQVKAEKLKELSEKSLLNSDGSLQTDAGPYIFKSTFVKQARDTFTNPEVVKKVIETNSPEKVLKAKQNTQNMYHKNLDLENIQNNPAEFNKVATDLYAFTKTFGMPMEVMRNGFFVKKTYIQERRLGTNTLHREMFLNSNNHLATLEYATNGTYNLNATHQAGKGNLGGLKEIYSRVFKTEAQKNAVPLEKFIQLQIARGQKLGLAEANPSAKSKVDLKYTDLSGVRREPPKFSYVSEEPEDSPVLPSTENKKASPRANNIPVTVSASKRRQQASAPSLSDTSVPEGEASRPPAGPVEDKDFGGDSPMVELNTKSSSDLRTDFVGFIQNAESFHGGTPQTTKDAREENVPTDKKSKDIGFGHKLTRQELKSGEIHGIPIKDEQGNFIPITEENATFILEKDMEYHTGLARRKWDAKLAKIGTSWEELDEPYRLVLSSLAFNVGGNKAGSQWSAILEAAKNKDILLFAKELRRKDAGRNTKGMDNRAAKELYAAGLINDLSDVKTALPLATDYK